jgi:poly-gamma-glutamate synthesis protein (capsule biosynthesis protein)
MTGRGVDQLLPHPSVPGLHEPHVRDAREYVRLAERAHGPLPARVPFDDPWGDALAELARASPAARIVNLETSVTTAQAAWPHKGIHYRMHPSNVPCLVAAGLDCCCLANNHTADWGLAGLVETVATLRAAGIATAGAGSDLVAAAAPAVLPTQGGRVLVFALASADSGVPAEWAAAAGRPGVNLLPQPPGAAVPALAADVRSRRRPGDVVIASLHWGGNWGFSVPAWQRELAHRLVDEAGIDVVDGHSSHHVKGIEVHRGRLILYGCGDLLTDYEGIGGFAEHRGDLGLMYFPTLDRATGELLELHMTPVRMERMRLRRADGGEARWLRDRLSDLGSELGTRVEADATGRLELRWTAAMPGPAPPS